MSECHRLVTFFLHEPSIAAKLSPKQGYSSFGT